MKLACVADKKGRIQHNRILLLKKLIKSIDIDVFTYDDKIKYQKYDAVYCTHFSLSAKMKIPNNIRKLASITSHKCTENNSLKKTLSALSQFDAISVNNNILLDFFKDKVDNLYYTPNGVDRSLFKTSYRPITGRFVFGWVGNGDRDTKNFKTIADPLRKAIPEADFKYIVTSKKQKSRELLIAKKMKEYYDGLNFFLVTSSTEGTPNPGLEAMSCCKPTISTRVGNMVDIINDGVSGYLVDDNLDSFIDIIKNKVLNMSITKYNEMIYHVAHSMLDWDWSVKYKDWERFFKSD